MKKRILMSLLTIVISGTMIGGATMSWFTDATTPIVNEFTAGTVVITADETIKPILFMQENWNPGDIAEKEYTITNTGTKGIYLRAIITGKWYEADGVTEFIPDPYEEVVTWSFHDSEPAQNWTRIGDTWYYNSSIKGTFTEPSLEARKVTLHLKVCFNGPKSGNQYEGKVFKLSAVFESVQSSNGAVDEVWAGNPY